MDIEEKKKTIKKTLRAAKIYDKKLDPQIELTVKLEVFLEKLHAELEKSDMYYISEKGVPAANPLVAAINKTIGQLQNAYTALGLTYDIAPTKIHEAKASNAKKATVDRFMDMGK